MCTAGWLVHILFVLMAGQLDTAGQPTKFSIYVCLYVCMHVFFFIIVYCLFYLYCLKLFLCVIITYGRWNMASSAWRARAPIDCIYISETVALVVN